MSRSTNLRSQSTRPKRFARLTSLIVWLCVFSLGMPTQMAALVSAESGYPAEEDGKSETSEREVVASISRQRGGKSTQRQRYRVSSAGPLKIASYVRPQFAIVGHQLANGIAAPRLI